ncbi:formamidopyrimidine-DNA glycosylase [Gloeothece citriformis PCC 7424]|uniref:Formamidopyrimidine-DNA glycosylase n=1 Tax=Gloeothece citriformis (strain PCC 7424) TaxID=65393 RepID=B7KGW6_GLOC7|nr:DNA-formamidopyrimidine glycosylase [Gloeothece citriformis]ACK73453.1 formamidopyrimidine-DNA glycosylase [Gloeothece citriformis PCC 7424]
MPELPEVETVCRGLNQLTLGQPIEGGEVLLPRTLAYPFSIAEFWEGITGTKINLWQRRGKYLLALLDCGGYLGVHLRMTGQLLWVKRDISYPKHTRLRLFLGEDQELRFVDTRTFGKVWWIPPDQSPEKIITGLQKLGVEPFSQAFSVEYLQHKLKTSRRKIKSVLLDQEVVAGIGNIYADEALFKSGIRPDAIACSLTPQQLEKLRWAICDVLQTSIDKGGTTFSDFLSVTGVNGNYGGVAWVYGRGGESCRVCGTPIERVKLGGRSSHFCPSCQG